MLTTLLESRQFRPSDKRGAVASVGLHAAIIFAAVYATATGAPAKDGAVDPPAIHWVPVPPPRSATSTPAPDRTRRTSATAQPTNPLVVAIDVPTSLPSIDFQAQPVTTSDFVRGTRANAGVPNQPMSGNGSRAYDASEVEVAVTVIGNIVPEYPSALRAAGIEGRVVAEFVVTELGRADVRSLRIISATNDGFAESIRRALSRMRFRPASIGEHAVAQLVQQQFVFRLDR
jgi:TonB family protein